MTSSITHEELEKTEKLLNELEDTNKFHNTEEGSYHIPTCITRIGIAINGVQQEVDDFYESINSNDYDQPDPQDVLDAILDDQDLDKYRAGLRNVISTDKAEKVIEEIESHEV